MMTLRAVSIGPASCKHDVVDVRALITALGTMLQHLTAASAYDLGWVTLTNSITKEGSLDIRKKLALLEEEMKIPSTDTPADAMTLEHHPMSSFMYNPFLTVFTAIRDSRSRLLAETHEDPGDVTTQRSVEAKESKKERSAEELLHRFMEVVLLYFSHHTKGTDWLRR